MTDDSSINQSPTTQQPPPEAKCGDAYNVEERLGAGAGSVVYRAKQTASGRDVRFKVLREAGHVDHPLNTEKLLGLREALASLKHPHIAEWLDAYEDPDGFILVHDYLAGMNGGMFPTKQRLNANEARTLARQLCQALQAGEQAGIRHGDLKPSNLVIAPNEREGVFVQVLDWGLSSCRAEQNQESLFFMAPEVLRGAAPSSQSDLFSAAATLCYLLTTCVPVQGATREELLAGWPDFDAMVLAKMRPDLDGHFLKWIAWLMQVNPANRPATVAKALEVLWQVIAFANAGKPVAVPTEAQLAAASAPTERPPKRSSGPRAPAPAPATRRPVEPESVPAPTPTPAETPPPKPPERRWLRGLAIAGIITLTLTGIVSAWLRFDWGPGWTEELGRRWEQWSFENLPDFHSRRSTMDDTSKHNRSPDAGLLGATDGKRRALTIGTMSAAAHSVRL